MLPCDYQHLVFTLPYELRDLAKHNRRLNFNLMSSCLSASLMQFIKKNTPLGYVSGIVSIIHTFGKGMKWHPHFHVLITAGGMKQNKWMDNSYLNEDFFKKSYKAKMLKGLRKLYRQEKLVKAKGIHPYQSFLKMLSDIYEKNWYVWIDQARGNGIVAFQYIGRYCKRACVSNKGIIAYKEGKLVKWKERRTVDTPDICAYSKTPHDFLELLIQHIPNTYDHQVRYYGIYSSRNKKTLYVAACKIFKRKAYLKKTLSGTLSRFSKLMRLLHGFDPLVCPICEKDLTLTGIVFFNPLNPHDKDILLNHEIKNYVLVEKQPDTS